MTSLGQSTQVLHFVLSALQLLGTGLPAIKQVGGTATDHVGNGLMHGDGRCDGGL